MAEAKQILSQIIQTGISNHSSSLSAILSFSATSPQGDLHLASLIFAHIEKPNSFVCNSMIRGFASSRNPDRALFFYLQMNREKSIADKFTFPFVLKACAVLLAVEVGRSVHGKIIQLGFSSDPFICSGLVRMYSEFNEIDVARKLFDATPERDFVLWNSMIGGYLKCGLLDPARGLFDNMSDKNVGTFNAILGGYVRFGCLAIAHKLFEEMPERDVVSWNTMIGAHARCGSVGTAQKLFNDAPVRNVTTWSAIISGFAQSSRFQDGLEIFKEMVLEGAKPNQAILVSVLSSCAHLGALEQGIWIHAYIEKHGIEVDDVLGSSLIDMYSKCGFLQGSRMVFDKIVKKDVCAWTSMIYGFAIHGHSLRALNLFAEMEAVGIRPNNITFVAILCACSHSGLVDKGREIFNRINRSDHMRPTIEHYTCMVDLLSRANLLDEAQDLIKAMPMEPDDSVFGALLSGFNIHRRRCLGNEDVGKQITKLQTADSGAYVLMSNMYASIEQWDEVARMRRMMVGMGVKKNPGCSLIEVLMSNDNTFKVVSVGSVRIKMFDGVERILIKVKHVPDLRKILISPGALEEALDELNAEKRAMDDKMDSFYKNEMWELVELPIDRKVIVCK
ncbi:pentatricopeptide repeat-containing protein At3g29230-like [Magnolia sinica]|uniref:pentatricopeptide repeat-containing protein At3g29230-like n=1 Tax=Magnolia sinica TaxID=86752 RepID=UPI00265AA948|nr:pentatricopeptide repeat-containing protein At3g29230-like [Magnolia sinica]